ncbi:SRPBCC domain-containing protein [Streptomyces lasiicapitis]|uniref:SRPBCC domain-containing protein n=1 Tax=Streptomyces lasiicapitis TaxID=1923961 RepID=UPI00331B277E
MEHEAFVPVPEEPLREALADPERVAGAVPGLQRAADADSPPVSGRLRVRVGGHTITYRGALRVAPRGDGSYSLEGEGAEVRGSGAVKFSLVLRLAAAAEGGTSVAFSGSASGDGRVAEIAESSPQAVEGAVRRLLGRFAEGLAVAGGGGLPGGDAGAAGGVGGAGDSADAVEPSAGSSDLGEPVGFADSSDSSDSSDSAGSSDSVDSVDSSGPGESGDSAGPEEPMGPTGSGDGTHGIFRAEVPPPPLDPLSDDLDGPLDAADVPAAEAAHARRTMIGRSAEEVDHAPPRGRYAPVPVPEAMSGGVATLRWAAPVAAVALASAIVVTRALRRRR